ncbi:MAG TPA: glycosyltransferase family 39 protein [Roseiflexaceae bacterium]|nr:glycosyltransferase family 39 protein [Roseiflexaceae bacterium]
MTRRHASAVGTAALLLGAACCYILTLTEVHTFDALSYVTSVERKPWQEVFHPHHLAYGPLGTLALAAGRVLGYAGGAALPMQLVNAVAGALGVALLFRVLLHLTGRTDLALAAALLMGSTYAYWYYAVEIEVYTVATVLLIVCLSLMTRVSQPGQQRPIWLYAGLGLAQAGAVLFHQTNVLLCGPVVVWLALSLRDGERRTEDGKRRTGLRGSTTDGHG